MCPMMDAARPDFIEAAIYKARKGREAGQYVATCAKDECGYIGASNEGVGGSGLALTHLHRSVFGETLWRDGAHEKPCLPRCILIKS